MLQWNIAQIEMNPLEKKICCDQNLFIAIRQHSGIVTHSFLRRVISKREIFGKTVNQPELANA